MWVCNFDQNIKNSNKGDYINYKEENVREDESSKKQELFNIQIHLTNHVWNQIFIPLFNLLLLSSSLWEICFPYLVKWHLVFQQILVNYICNWRGWKSKICHIQKVNAIFWDIICNEETMCKAWFQNFPMARRSTITNWWFMTLKYWCQHSRKIIKDNK